MHKRSPVVRLTHINVTNSFVTSSHVLTNGHLFYGGTPKVVPIIHNMTCLSPSIIKELKCFC